MGFSSRLDLSTLDGTNGFVINGIDSDDNSGFAVSNAGDINGDGIGDLLIGAYFASDNDNVPSGESYVVFGSRAGFGSTFNLADLNGNNGFILKGIDNGDFSGRAVSTAGDVNGEGVDDLIIGAFLADPNDVDAAGESYVVFGSRTGFSPSFNLADLNGTNGFVLNGIDRNGQSGYSVSDAGDVNNDGIDDLIIGSPNSNDDNGESYVVFGARTGFGASIDLSTLNGSNGFTIRGSGDGESSGRSVSRAGDMNGDGIDDLIIGAPSAAPNDNFAAGKSYVVFGIDTSIDGDRFGAIVDLNTLDGSNGFALNGIGGEDVSGSWVSEAGDINGDGIDDVIVGAFFAAANGNSVAGQSYVVFGSRSGFSPSLNLAELDGTNGFVINGIEGGDRSGHAVSTAGDINADGIDDLIIGAPEADPNGKNQAGESYVIFGSRDGFDASFDLATLNGNNGFVLSGIDDDDLSGRAASNAGDVNGDGVDDIIIGAPDAFPDEKDFAGESYVVFGKATLSLSVSDPTATETGDTASFTVSRGAASGGNLTVPLTLTGSADSDDYRFNTGTISGTQLTVTIPDGQSSVNVTLTALADNVIEDNETLTLSLVETPTYFLDPTANQGSIILIDENTAGFSLSKTAVAVDETGITDSVTVSLITQPRSPVVLQLSNSDASEVLASPNTLTFTPDNWNQPQTLTFTGVDDGVSDGDQISNITVSVVDASSDDAFDALSDQSISVTTTDIVDGQMGVALQAIAFPQQANAITLKETTGGKLLRGSPQADWIEGGAGNDRIISGRMSDSFGQDRLLGYGGHDRLRGGKGRDYLDGGNGRDRLWGGKSRDHLIGGAGRDRLWGLHGNDVLIGGKGNDRLVGGTGIDTFVYRSLDEGKDTIKQFEVEKDLIDLSGIFEDSAFAGSTDFKRFIRFVDLVTVGSNTEVRVDTDGSGTGTDFTTLAVVKGVTGLTSQNIVVS